MFETFEGLPHNLTYREMHLFAIFNHRRCIWEHNRWCCVFLCIWQYFSITCTCRSQSQLDFFLVHISLAEMRKKPYVTNFFISTCTDSGLSQCVLYFDLMWLSKTVTDIATKSIQVNCCMVECCTQQGNDTFGWPIYEDGSCIYCVLFCLALHSLEVFFLWRSLNSHFVGQRMCSLLGKGLKCTENFFQSLACSWKSVASTNRAFLG